MKYRFCVVFLIFGLISTLDNSVFGLTTDSVRWNVSRVISITTGQEVAVKTYFVTKQAELFWFQEDRLTKKFSLETPVPWDSIINGQISSVELNVIEENVNGVIMIEKIQDHFVVEFRLVRSGKGVLQYKFHVSSVHQF